MVSTPGDVPLVVQEVTDLVRHDANERFAIVEHRWIALVDNHEYLLIRQILPSRLSSRCIVVADEKAREIGAALLVRDDVLSKSIPRDFWPQGFLDRKPRGIGQSEKDVRLSGERPVQPGEEPGHVIRRPFRGVDHVARSIEVLEESERDREDFARQNGDLQPDAYVAAHGFEFRNTDTFGRDLETARKALGPRGAKQRCTQTQQLIVALLAFLLPIANVDVFLSDGFDVLEAHIVNL